MKNKGFTLAEMIGVIVILSILALISFPIVTGIIKKAKQNTYNEQVNKIISATNNWIIENGNLLDKENSNCVSLHQLKAKGFLSNKKINDPVNDEEMNGFVKLIYNENYNQFDMDYVEKCDCNYKEKILNGGYPELIDGMIPIKYIGGKTVVADKTDQWYSYANKEWANVVIVKPTVIDKYISNNAIDTEINATDILGYFVWIPRFKYVIGDPNVVFQTVSDKREEGTNTGQEITPPGFKFGDKELNGIWISKFQATGTIDTPTFLPNEKEIVNYNIATYYTASRKVGSSKDVYGIEADTHLTKTTEIGLVYYLTFSQYGTKSDLIGLNKYYKKENEIITFISGASYTGKTPAFGIKDVEYSEFYMKTSTTENEYGVYDLRGSSQEAQMSLFYSTEISQLITKYDETNDSGFKGYMGSTKSFSSIGIDLPESKYYDQYSTEKVKTACNNGPCYGHGLSEIYDEYNSQFINFNNPWLCEGPDSYKNASKKMGFTIGTTGAANTLEGFRIVIIPN